MKVMMVIECKQPAGTDLAQPGQRWSSRRTRSAGVLDMEKFMGVKFPEQKRPRSQQDFCDNVINCGRLECYQCGFHPSNKVAFQAWLRKQEQLARAARMIMSHQRSC